MVVIKDYRRVIGPRMRGRFGFSQADRLHLRSYADALAVNPHAGIYQQRRRKGGSITVREKFYWPANPRTDTQQAWRAVFTAGVVAYHALSADDKKYWKKKGAKYHMTGYNKFLSEWLHSH